jgi:hypothetical protein
MLPRKQELLCLDQKIVFYFLPKNTTAWQGVHTSGISEKCYDSNKTQELSHCICDTSRDLDLAIVTIYSSCESHG